jgi:MFS family permease
MTDKDSNKTGWKAIPRGVWALGVVSLFMDMSSELVHGLLPVFLTVSLGASAATVGLLEGIAEATVCVAKMFSGVLSDRWGKRKPLVLLGYGTAALTKPLFPLASSVSTVFVARFLDRIGKGIRGAPRDALVADISPPHLRGACFGLRQSLDTVGAFIGPLAAIGLMLAFHDNIRTVLWFAVVPAFIAVLVLALGVEEPDAPKDRAKKQPPIRLTELRRLGAAYWRVVAVGGAMTLARFSEAFLVLRAQGLGLPVALAPLVLVVMSVVYAASAYPAGAISDRMDRRMVLAIGLMVLMAADAVLAMAAGPTVAMVGIGLWGLHMGLTQGVLSSLVADAAPGEARGTAFGLFNLLTGLLLLAASVTAGLLWDTLGPSATFWTGGGFALIALVGMMAMRCQLSGEGNCKSA